jgi:molybdopterin-synthase adenylyltransferase
MMEKGFSYSEFTTRNIGFVSKAEQNAIKASTVFVCGTGGMGGAALMALARAGVGHFILADIDVFEVSNLNRQLFAFTNTVGSHKAEAAAKIVATINPEAQIEILHDDWPDHIDRIAGQASLFINGTDDLAAGVLLYRKARAAGLAVIDAYASPLPSVYVTRAGQPMPEERLGYPTVGKTWNALSKGDRDLSFQAEAIHILVHSSSRNHIDLEAAGEVAAGRRSRMSFAPMVISTGMLMAYEALAIITGKSTGTDHQGYFFNPYRPAVERPRSALVAAILKPIVRRFLNKMMASV